ncbi:EG45-like domain containing protein 2 [Eucalyptus grandis]|uniref:EG45-like domain containing protein 2 n=1 Tax=Eucalyptus grandis TaxID=71139 RepID=UPI00192EC875|nr:EG45-like domain containing protein 2 [Eucalyptus grandis]XP_039173021.1 EG45-like domain containing protein 2 [Eucalyptus grandis]
MATGSLLLSQPLHLLHLLLFLLLLLAFMLPKTISVATGDDGTASYYVPPYERTECYGEGSSQFPESNFFAAVGDNLWDLGAACGREYEVRCISKAQSGPGPCKPGSDTIRVKVVDYALSVSSSAASPKQSVTGADLVLSQIAFEAIANPSVDSITVELKEV